MKELIEYSLGYLTQLIEQVPDDLREELFTVGDALYSIYKDEAEEEKMPEIFFDAGVTFLQLHLGNHPLNKELAIDHFRTALGLWDRKDFPDNWAATMHALGNAYYRRIEGERRANLEKSIHCYEQALEEFRRVVVPLQWAGTMYALGNAYCERIEGKPRSNLEKSIHCYEQALEEFRRVVVPLQWAMTMHVLGNAYSIRIEGERRANLEKSIHCYEQALEEFRRVVVPLDWAATTYALGNAYSKRIEGEPRTNLEKSINCYEQALEEYRRVVVPLQWAMTMHALGIAYCDRIEGERRTNLEKSINCHEQALEEFRREMTPLQWAATMYTLGNTYCDRIEGEPRDNLEKAINCFEKTLEEYRREVVPLDWAMTMHALGNAYFERIEGKPRINLEKAIHCYEQALEEWRREVVPLNWAITMYALGGAYKNKGDNEQALTIYDAASQESDRNASHDLFIYFNSAYGGCQLSCGRRNGDPALKAAGIHRLKTSIEAIEQTRSSIIGQASRKEFLARNLHPYVDLVEHYLAEKAYDEAWHWMERSRSRVLLESVDLSVLKPSRPEAEKTARAYWELSKKINRLRAQLLLEEQQGSMLSGPEGYRQRPRPVDFPGRITAQTQAAVDDLEEQRRQVLKALSEKDADYAAIITGTPIDQDQLQVFLKTQKAASASFLVRSGGIDCLISYAANGTVAYQPFPLENTDLFDSWKIWFDAYQRPDHENKKMQYSLLDQLLEKAGELIAPIHQFLEKKGIKRLFVSPHDYLHLIPLHAARLNGSGTYLLESISVSYAPSITLTARMAEGNHQHQLSKDIIGVFAAQQGADYLHFGEQEIDMLKDIYGEATVTPVKHVDATIENIGKELGNGNDGIGQLALSCHGGNNSEDPSRSSVYLSNGKPAIAPHYCQGRHVYARELLSHLRGTSIQLAILSACETGQSFSLQGIEEYVGLDSVFMQMSVPRIISSQYSINDWSTSEVMRRFHMAVKGDTAPALALQKAQTAFINEKLEPSEEAKNINRFKLGKSESIPVDYSHPYYWAFLKYSGVFE